MSKLGNNLNNALRLLLVELRYLFDQVVALFDTERLIALVDRRSRGFGRVFLHRWLLRIVRLVARCCRFLVLNLFEFVLKILNLFFFFRKLTLVGDILIWSACVDHVD